MTTSARIRKFAAPTALTPAPCMCILTKRSVRPWSSTSAIARMQPEGVTNLTVTTGSSVSSSTMSNAMSPGRQRMATYTPLAYNFQALEFCRSRGDVRRSTAPAIRLPLQGRTWPVPRTTYLKVVSCSTPTGPRACRRPVAMPISAPMPNSPPSANWVEALCSTMALSSAGEEALGGRLVFRDDAVGVLRAVLADVGDRRVDAVDDLHRDDGVEILGRPVLLGRRLDPGIGLLRSRVAAHLAARPRAAPRPAPAACPRARASTSSVSVAPHTPVRRILALTTMRARPSPSRRRGRRRCGRCLPGARTPARAPRPARAPTRLLPPRGTITSMAPSRPFEHHADRLAVGGRHQLDGVSGRPAARSPRPGRRWMARLE